MFDKMTISVHILKIVENDPFFRLQMTAKEMFISKWHCKGCSRGPMGHMLDTGMRCCTA